MVGYSTPPEAIDDAFIQILAQELIWKTSPSALSPAGEGSSHGRGSTGQTASSSPDQSSQRVQPVVGEAGRSPSGSEMRAADWRVRVVETKGPEQLLTFAQGPVTIGRSRDNSVIVRCPRVSRRHVRIWLEDAGPWAEDLSGRGYMQVNGTSVPNSGLHPGDVIEIGTVKIFIEYLGPNHHQAL